ncbi:hypothetical protein Taro_016989 [Colocasia esculenta]|uniref:Uncharacterized protein n=1 Tax=Colocasia esculenta TaxID=4460 RepID=A0A843UF58_COLES|nr:hypothetical protein [Colocasia esculenta]
MASHVAFRTPAEQSFHRLCSTSGELLRGFLAIRGSGSVWGRVLATRTSCGAGGNAWSSGSSRR